MPKGPGANPALAALAGNDNVAFKPSVKHIISKELILYFEKIQTALLDETPDEEVMRLREAALESVRSDPGLHQLVPYFVTFISNQVTHHLDSVFVLRQMMELTAALVVNPHLFLDLYASALSSAILTCLMSRKIGRGSSGSFEDDALAQLRTQFELREFSASLLGQVAKKYAHSSSLFRPKITRTCLKYFLVGATTTGGASPPAPVLFGAISGLSAAGGPQAVRLLVVPTLGQYDGLVLQLLRERVNTLQAAGGSPAAEVASIEYEALVGAIVKALRTMVGEDGVVGSGVGLVTLNHVNGGSPGTSPQESSELIQFLGPIVGERIAALGDHALNQVVLEARGIE